MQDCFRKYPDVYGDELTGDEEEGATAATHEDPEIAPAKEITEEPTSAKPIPKASEPEKAVAEDDGSGQHQELREDQTEKIPKPAFDATAANKGKEQ